MLSSYIHNREKQSTWFTSTHTHTHSHIHTHFSICKHIMCVATQYIQAKQLRETGTHQCGIHMHVAMHAMCRMPTVYAGAATSDCLCLLAGVYTTTLWLYYPFFLCVVCCCCVCLPSHRYISVPIRSHPLSHQSYLGVHWHGMG